MSADIEEIELVTFWGWNENSVGIRVTDIKGGGIPSNLVSQLKNELSESLSFPRESKIWKKANHLINQFAQSLPEPETILDGRIQAEITAMRQATCESSGVFSVLYEISYSNGRTAAQRHKFQPDSFTQAQLDLARTINIEANKFAFDRFNEIFGGGEFDLQKWKADKVEVFISYRTCWRSTAMELRDSLGNYDNRTVFIPRIDFVDLQEGNWIDQLQDQINKCAVFIPMLTQDYLEGPIAKQEFHQAFRLAVSKGDKRIIPVLIEGNINDYKETFLGNYNIIEAQSGIVDDVVKRIAYWALEISENEFDL